MLEVYNDITVDAWEGLQYRNQVPTLHAGLTIRKITPKNNSKLMSGS